MEVGQLLIVKNDFYVFNTLDKVKHKEAPIDDLVFEVKRGQTLMFLGMVPDSVIQYVKLLHDNKITYCEEWVLNSQTERIQK